MLNETAVVDVAENAIANGSGMAFIYEKENGDVEERRIVPFKVDETKAGDLIVRAFDRDRNAIRSWRIDRICVESIVFFDPRALDADEDKNYTLFS
jgi:hypothetical protein